MHMCFFSRKQNAIAYLIPLIICSGCGKLCYLEEVPSGHTAPNVAQSNLFGYGRFQDFMHKNGGRHNLGESISEDAFKIRFYNYMMGKVNDDPKQITEQARKISDAYKKRRMYDAASKYDSYQDVLIYGAETIPESWEDTTDLLEEMQLEMQKKRSKRKALLSKNCRRCPKDNGDSIGDNSYSLQTQNNKSNPVYQQDSIMQVQQGNSVAPIIVMPPPGMSSYHGEPVIGPASNAIVNTGNGNISKISNNTKTCTKCSINADDPGSDYF